MLLLLFNLLMPRKRKDEESIIIRQETVGEIPNKYTNA
jgi:hypothetical protein